VVLLHYRGNSSPHDGGFKTLEGYPQLSPYQSEMLITGFSFEMVGQYFRRIGIIIEHLT
jgi:hypothetical protein